MSLFEEEALRRLSRRRKTLAEAGAPEELRRVESALSRLASGHWGRCMRCDRAIGRDRLRAMPEAELCLNCSSVPLGSVLPEKGAPRGRPANGAPVGTDAEPFSGAEKLHVEVVKEREGDAE